MRKTNSIAEFEPICSSPRRISLTEYRQLAELRYRIRRFTNLSEGAARDCGIEPQQHLFLLAVKGLPEESLPTLKTISERLCLRHNSVVEMADRLEKTGAVRRKPSERDRREVLVELTEFGEQILYHITISIWPDSDGAQQELFEVLRTSLPGLPHA